MGPTCSRQQATVTSSRVRPSGRATCPESRAIGWRLRPGVPRRRSLRSPGNRTPYRADSAQLDPQRPIETRNATMLKRYQIGVVAVRVGSRVRLEYYSANRIAFPLSRDDVRPRL